jgi:TfoX/Sxy family transcriptional regulator of competence genes
MEIPRPTDEDKAAFNALVPERPDVVVKPMFGNLGAFVNGNMFMGLFGPSIGVKLEETDREALLSVDGAGPFGPPERPMGGYVSLPASWRTPTRQTEDWVNRSVEYVAALPAKAPKKSKTPKPT